MAASSQSLFDEIHFGIEIDFRPNTPDPSRVYRSMTSLIGAFQSIDSKLAGTQITPVLFLEDIQTGSLTTFLRSILESVDEDALKSLEWKKLVGSYLVKGKRVMVNYLKNRETIQGSAEIYDLQKAIVETANETGVADLQIYRPMPAMEVAQAVLLLSEGTTPLAADDRAKYISPDSTDEINTRFRVTPDRIEEVLTQKTIVNPRDLILKVKKPDFLGDSTWDFRHDNKKLTAKVADLQWLEQFHRGAVTLHPGDALDVAAEETVKYGYDQEVIATHYRVIRVRDVLRKESN